MDIWDNEYVCDPHAGGNAGPDIKYMEFDRRLHIAAPFKFPSDYRHFFGMDWGMAENHPAVGLWVAVSPTGMVYVYDELTITGVSAQRFATDVLRQSVNKIEAFVLSEDCFAQESDQKTIASKMMQFGLRPAVKAKRENKAFSGADTVKHYLKPVQGNPKVQIFPNCFRLIDNLETLKWSDKLNDDPADALRHLLVFLSTLNWTPKQEEKHIFKPVEINLLDRFKERDSISINPETGYIT